MATAEASEIRETKHFIGGEWTDPIGGATFEDRNPFSGDVVAHVAAGDGDDAERAIDAAAEAFAAWSQTPPEQRQRIFLKAADILESRQDEVVGWLARETGCTFGFAMFQCHFVPGLFRQAAALAYAPLGEIIPSDTGAFSMGIRRPVGRRRRDRALECGAHPLGARDLGAARARQHRRPQALGALALRRRAPLGRDLHGGRAPGGRAERRHPRPRRGGADRRSAWSRTRACR